MASGLALGAPLNECLQQAANSADIKAYRVALTEMFSTGTPTLSEGFQNSPTLFSTQSIWLTEQGEQLENLPEALQTASDITVTELENYCKKLSVNGDTFFLCAMGLFVFMVILGLWLPLYQIIGNLG